MLNDLEFAVTPEKPLWVRLTTSHTWHTVTKLGTYMYATIDDGYETPTNVYTGCGRLIAPDLVCITDDPEEAGIRCVMCAEKEASNAK